MDMDRETTPSYFSSRGSREFVLDEHIKNCREGSERVVQTLKCDIDIPYGAAEKECIDIFYPEQLKSDSPTFVFIHGGYWVDMSRQLSRFPAESFTKSGCIVAIVGYQQAPQVTLPTIIQDTVNAIKLILERVGQISTGGVYICGHSAGAHLLSMAMSRNWDRHFGEHVHLLKGLIFLSIVSDLRLIVGTSNNTALGLSSEEAWDLSPLRLAGELATESLNHNCDVMCYVGGEESKTFINWTQDFSKALENNHLKNKCCLLENIDHFNMIENLISLDYSLTQDILSSIGRSKKQDNTTANTR